ncbi:MAG TPA: hypothetical protein EYO33_17385, partial [Phycisphaerales bacterium]|nr:hypothetical protein [Phycisphaerales bacterium]
MEVSNEALDELQNEFETVNQNWLSRIKELEEEIAELNSAIDDARADYEEAQASANSEKESLESIIEAMKSELAQNEERRQTLTEDVEDLTYELQQTREHVVELETTIDGLEEQGRELEDSLTSSKNQNRELTDKLSQTHQRLEDVSEKLENTEANLKKRLEEREQLVHNLESTVKQAKSFREMAARSQKEVAGLREYIEKLQTLSKEKLEQARTALEKRDHQLKKQMNLYNESRDEIKRLERRIERSQLAEAALKGALTDLRGQVSEKAAMVEELEWHLGLVYQTLEEGQIDLEAREVELDELTGELDDKDPLLQQNHEELEELQAQLKDVLGQKEILEHLKDELEEQLDKTESELLEQKEELERANFHLNRSQGRLERVLVDLTEEQERSARLGAQLTDALEDRNRRVQRLRELQREFSEWRDSKGDDTDAQTAAQIEELSQELTESQQRELELQKAMTELRESLSEQIQLREDFEQKLKDMEEQQGGAFADQAVDAPSVTSGALKEEVSQGIRLGAQVLSAQMDVLQTRSVRDSLSEMMNQVETKDALAEVLEDLRRTDEELEHRGALLEALESEWTQFREQTSPEAVALLDDLIGIVENEMKQSRAAEARVALLQQQLEDITLGDASPDNSIQEEIDDLKAQLEERTILADELEEELATVSAQLTELNDQLVREQNHAPPISWSENSALRDELKEKTELLE